MNIDLIKAKVLDLAIKGQLVEQRDDEKLSDEILALPNIDGSFQIPANWKFVYLNNIGNFFSGKTPHKENLTEKEGIPYFKVSDMNTYGNEKYLNNTSLYINKTLKIKTYPAFSIVFPKNGGAVLTYPSTEARSRLFPVIRISGFPEYSILLSAICILPG